MGEAKRRGNIEERTQQAIERNKREAEEREEKRQQHLAAEREARRLQWDKEDAVTDYIKENNNTMEVDKLYILDVAGEEVNIQLFLKDDVTIYRVKFSEGREVVDYEILKDDDSDIVVVEVKDSRLSVRKRKQYEETMAMMSAMSGLGAAYERGIYGR